MSPEWSDFKVLLALARGGSVAGAARELQVDNSTVSRRLAALEESVGAKLLLRGGREFSWTAEGRCLIEAAEAMEAAATAALRSVRAAKVDVEGSVRVSVAPAFVQMLMLELLPELRQAHPLLSVELQGSFQRADLARGDADIAVRMARPEEPDLVARRALELHWFVYASASYLEKHGHPRTFDDLTQHELVLFSEQLQSPPTRWLETYRGAGRSSSRVDSLETACHAAAASGGIAVLPAFIAAPVPQLRRVFADPVSSNVGWVVYHDCVRDASRVRVVADALLSFFQSREALFSGVR